MIVSNVACCNQLSKRADEFIKTVKDDIVKMDEEEFKDIKEGVASELLKKFENLTEEFKYYLKELDFRQYLFKRSRTYLLPLND